MKFVLLITSCLLVGTTSGQIISGVVTNETSGAPIENVLVFLDATTLSDKTTQEGRFFTAGVPAGYHKLILYKKGMGIYSSTIQVEPGRNYELPLTIKSNLKMSHSLTPELVRSLKEQVGIQESDTMVHIEKIEKLSAVSRDGNVRLSHRFPLIITNYHTGYRLYYYAGNCEIEAISSAPVRFEELPTKSLDQAAHWIQERLKLYKGSTQHWLKALISGQIDQEGYFMFEDSGRAVEAKSILSVSNAGLYKLSITRRLQINYRAEGCEETSYVIAKGPISMDHNGVLLTKDSLDVEGRMATIQMSYRLPITFHPQPNKSESAWKEQIKHQFEKVYVHTDKFYYKSGEQLLFNGYVQSREPAWLDTLSQTVFVELFGPDHMLLGTRVFPRKNGHFEGKFVLPFDIKDGYYYIRGYTMFNLNFHDSNLFEQPISVKKLTFLSGTIRYSSQSRRGVGPAIYTAPRYKNIGRNYHPLLQH